MQLHHIKPFVEQLKSEFYVDAESILEAVTHESSFNLLHDETLLSGRLHPEENAVRIGTDGKTNPNESRR